MIVTSALCRVHRCASSALAVLAQRWTPEQVRGDEETVMTDRPNYITPAGFAALRAEYDQLFAVERPQIVDTVAWAAGNGDRSENGDYIYGRRRLREIDRRLGWLSKRMKAAKVVDPAQASDRARVFFGATVTVVDEDDRERVLTLVGDDEADAGSGRVGWNAPLARALRGAAVGDLRRVVLPGGEREYEVTAVSYPAA
jgi:transcription elongation factor GreB